MKESKLQGYKGKLREALESKGADVGDLIRVEAKGNRYEGSLMPRLESADEEHIVLKLRSGYNVGIKFDDYTRVTSLGEEEKPLFISPPIPELGQNLPKVSVVSTGGTIASRVDYITGGVQAAISSKDLLSIVPELSEIALVDTDILFSIFSEDIKSDQWSGIARRVSKKVKEGVKGVVITHGTDTMGYSAAALSFALQGLPVPVIFVGSQRSSDRPSSDAATNLIGAVAAAVYAPFAEVVIAMHGTTSDESIVFHRGTKVRKCHTSARYAFQSINVDPIAKFVDNKIEMTALDYTNRQDRELRVKDNFEKKVALIKFFPGFHPEVIDWFIDDGYKGIIIEGTGLGHVGTNCYESIRRGIKNGVILGMTSQCIWGRISMNVYATGRELMRVGVESLGDMLSETALVKLMWALGQTDDVEKVRQIMGLNIAGEYSDRTLYKETYSV